MRLRVLGSSGTYPTADNPASGFLLEGGDARIWLEAGSGTFAALQAVEEPTEIDALVITHAHGDHCLDIFPFHYALLLHPEGPRRLPLYCPPETWKLLAGFFDHMGHEKLGRTFDLHPVDVGDVVDVGNMRLRFERTEHSLPTVAIRFESEDGSLAYTADTGPEKDLARFVHGADLLLAEATYQKARPGPPIHLSAEQAGELALRGEVGSLVLTHLAPRLDPARSLEEARATAGSLPVSLARPGKVFQIAARE